MSVSIAFTSLLKIPQGIQKSAHELRYFPKSCQTLKTLLRGPDGINEMPGLSYELGKDRRFGTAERSAERLCNGSAGNSSANSAEPAEPLR